ncbi:MAG: hypothetical protein R3F54_28310 [Alphaproteobacteria bacterium]
MISAHARRLPPADAALRPDRLAALRRLIGRIEGHGGRSGGLARDGVRRDEPPLIGEEKTRPALHELVADAYLDHPAARDFALALIARLMQQADDQSMVLWCQRRLDSAEFGQLYGPGLKAFGLPPERFLMVTGRRDADCLWAMEQGLASRSLLAVVGQVGRADLIASRRLSLAAKAHGTFCFLLPIRHGRDPSAARTRWRIRSAESRPDHLDPEGLGKPAWHLELERSPHGQTGHWTVEWDHAAHHFSLVSKAGDQPAAAAAARRSSPDKTASEVIAFERTG